MNDFGYGQYAASNDLIVIYPQQKWDWYNPMTCPDYRGYSTMGSRGYLTNKGPQMKAYKAMLDRLVEPRDASKWDYMSDAANIYGDSVPEAIFWGPYLFMKNSFEFVMTFVT